MSNIERVLLKGEGDEILTMLVEVKTPIILPSELPDSSPVDENEKETYGLAEETVAKLKDVHHTIRAYAQYAIGAFRNMGDAEVEELNLKFGLKVAGKAGLPILTEGSAEANFEVEIKCKFPKKPNPLS
jgi:hypothetical protein